MIMFVNIRILRLPSTNWKSSLKDFKPTFKLKLTYAELQAIPLSSQESLSLFEKALEVSVQCKALLL